MSRMVPQAPPARRLRKARLTLPTSLSLIQPMNYGFVGGMFFCVWGVLGFAVLLWDRVLS